MFSGGDGMAEQVLESVRAKYGAVAESGLSSKNAGVKAVAEAFGYTAEELRSIPAGANMGLSCGNPTATAHIQPEAGWMYFWRRRWWGRRAVPSASI
jgi:hypothetical protein